MIKKLYGTLVDLTQDGQTTPLLVGMSGALGTPRQSERVETLKQEIDYWIAGRHHATIADYKEAIRLNGANPATRYERARLAMATGQFTDTLKDLDRLLELAEPYRDRTKFIAGVPFALYDQIRYPAQRLIYGDTALWETFLYPDRAAAYPHLQVSGILTIALQQPPRVRAADGMVQVYVPEGEFQMGSTDGASDEQPVHAVALSAFWLDQTEVTNAQFVAYLNQIAGDVEIETNEFVNYQGNPIYDLICTGCEEWGNRILWDGAQFSVAAGYEDHPVILTTWYGAQGYCVSVGGQLPTEAQWEYAARGPEGRSYPWGNDWRERIANCYVDYCKDSYEYTAPVGSFPEGASWVGVLDMSGNVWEWTNDWYTDTYSAGAQTNPAGPATGDYKVVRGGAFLNYPNGLRAAYRYYVGPDGRFDLIGFRCVGVSPGK